MDTTFATDLTDERMRADERLGLVTYAGGVVGIVGIVTLDLMFALEVPRGGPYVFGSTNDIAGAVFSALFIPLVVRLGRSAGGRPFDRLTTVTIAASIAGIVLPLMLVGGLIPFDRQVYMVVAVFEVQSLWLFVAGRRLRRVAGFPTRLAHFTAGVGVAIIAGPRSPGRASCCRRDPCPSSRSSGPERSSAPPAGSAGRSGISPWGRALRRGLPG